MPKMPLNVKPAFAPHQLSIFWSLVSAALVVAGNLVFPRDWIVDVCRADGDAGFCQSHGNIVRRASC